MPDDGVEFRKIPAGGCPVDRLKVSGQGTVVVDPLIKDRPVMPYFRQIIKIARMPVDGKDIEIWKSSHVAFASISLRKNNRAITGKPIGPCFPGVLRMGHVPG